MPITKSQSFNHNYDDIPIKSQNNIETSKSLQLNKDLKERKQNALKMLNGTLHKVDEEEKSENEISDNENENNNKNSIEEEINEKKEKNKLKTYNKRISLNFQSEPTKKLK